jgi:hypothetical protein
MTDLKFKYHVKNCDGKLKQHVKLPHIPLPYLPHVFSNKDYADSLAKGTDYKPIRIYITYDFETAINPKKANFGEGSTWIASLHPITVAWTVKSETNTMTFSLYRDNPSVHDFVQTWLNQMLHTIDFEFEQINVIGYNSARFDMSLILRDLVSQDWSIKSILGNVKMLILKHNKTQKEFRFIDALGFLSGGTLDQNAQAFNPGAGREKGYFPSEFLTIQNY